MVPYYWFSYSSIRTHCNKEHGLKREADEALYQRVRLQSWFRDGKERCWEVDEEAHAWARGGGRGEGECEGSSGSGSGSGSGSSRSCDRDSDTSSREPNAIIQEDIEDSSGSGSDSDSDSDTSSRKPDAIIQDIE